MCGESHLLNNCVSPGSHSSFQIVGFKVVAAQSVGPKLAFSITRIYELVPHEISDLRQCKGTSLYTSSLFAVKSKTCIGAQGAVLY